MSTKNLFVLNRNYVLSTELGHSIQFIKDEPVYVPPVVQARAIAIGATPADGSDPEVLGAESVKHDPQDPQERNPLIMDAILQLVARNERDDFNAAGMPRVDAVSKIVDFKVSAQEIAGQWQAYHDTKADQ